LVIVNSEMLCVASDTWPEKIVYLIR